MSDRDQCLQCKHLQNTSKHYYCNASVPFWVETPNLIIQHPENYITCAAFEKEVNLVSQY